jgi:4-hydroxy-3-polyprenylbenzoate decarboxylase
MWAKNMPRNIVVAITGASGVTYAVRLLEVLLAAGCNVNLLISPVGRTVLEQELDLSVDPENFSPAMLMLDSGAALRDPKLQLLRSRAGISSDASDVLGMGSGRLGGLRFYRHDDFLAPPASGSFATDGMVVCPCSCGTLSAIATGMVNNLIHRAAAVHLKERRKLILVPRETPLSLTQIENMRQATLSGAVILPAMPAFYHGAERIGDLVDFVVARICDQLAVANALIEPWGK